MTFSFKLFSFNDNTNDTDLTEENKNNTMKVESRKTYKFIVHSNIDDLTDSERNYKVST